MEHLSAGLGEGAGGDVRSPSADEAIRRIVALLQSAGDELDRQVRAELRCSKGVRAELCDAIE